MRLDLATAALPAGVVSRPGAPEVYPRHVTQIHALQCSQHLGSLGGRGAAIRWCREQGWGDSHTATVLKLAAQHLVNSHKETIDETRARLLTMLESELEDAANGVSYDKEGNQRTTKDRGAVAAFTKLVITLRGLDQTTVNHIHNKDRPLREMTTEQLLAEEARLGQEVADRAITAEVLTVQDEPIPSAEKTPVEQPLAAETMPAWAAHARDSGLALRVRAGSYGT